MRWGIVGLLWLVGCGAPRGEGVDNVDQVEPYAVERSEDGEAVRVFLGCEYGCPVDPWIEIKLGPRRADSPTRRAPDVAEDVGKVLEDVGSVICADNYDFRACCGDRVCQESESVFFCPKDCL